METAQGLVMMIPVIILLIFTGFIIYSFLTLLKDLLKKTWEDLALTVGSKVVNRNDDLEKYLLHRFSYYDKLSEQLKVKFLLRVKNFISAKTFTGREGLVVTNEMKSWVAASAVQLTFGLSKYSLNHFSRIILYPEAFYNKRNDALHIGETNAMGAIVLSWKDLQEGYEKATDNFNVGLHEMAHALELELLLRRDYDTFFGDYYPKWSLIAQQEFENIENERESFLRWYAGENKREFFAVCIEYFFESSAEFLKRLPEIYYHLTILLNQDPLQPDVRILETKQKSPDELISEIPAMVPVFKPEFSFFSLLYQLTLFVFIFLLFVVTDNQDKPEFRYMSLVIGAIAAISLYFRMNKIILYENLLVIKGLSGKVTSIYELNDIVAVLHSGDRTGNSLEVLQARQGRIIKSNHAYMAKSSDMEILFKKLREKKIVVK